MIKRLNQEAREALFSADVIISKGQGINHMFQKDQIIDRLRKVGFDAGEYWVVAGAAMVLHGVKESTGDRDH